MDSGSVQALVGASRITRLAVGLEALRIVRSFNCVTLTLLLWDMVLTIRTEIAVVWTARLSVVKTLFLLNRYLTPAVVILHLWTFSGVASGLNTPICRVIYSIAAVAEFISIAIVSLVIILRLYSLYELSHRAFYGILVFWSIMLMSAAALLITNFWLDLNKLVYSRSLNICVADLQEKLWTQWLPSLADHGFLAAFLTINAMSTPRPAQTRILAVIYRDGILYNVFAVIVLLATILIWRFTGPVYSVLALFSPGIFLAMASSHFLLSMKTCDSIQQISNSQPPPTSYRMSPLNFKHMAHDSYYRDDVTSDSVCSTSNGGHVTSGTSENMHGDGRSVRMQTTFLKKRAWWLFGATYERVVTDTLIEVAPRNDLGENGMPMARLQVSRLGRYDQWV